MCYIAQEEAKGFRWRKESQNPFGAEEMLAVILGYIDVLKFKNIDWGGGVLEEL